MNPEIPKYPPVPAPQPVPPPTPVARSVSREDAFSKPGSTKASSWKPAKGHRFRPTAEKTPGRPRKKPRDKRNVQFF